MPITIVTPRSVSEPVSSVHSTEVDSILRHAQKVNDSDTARMLRCLASQVAALQKRKTKNAND